MTGFTIKIDGLDKLQKVFKELPRQTRDGIKNELIAIGDEWAWKARADAPADRSRLRSSISAKVVDLGVEIVAQNNYAPFMEFGTKKQFKAPAELGNYPAQFRGPTGISDVDPLVALTAWVKRKGFAATYTTKTRQISTRAGKRTGRTKNEAKLEKSIAFMIWRKIKRDGVKPHPFLFTGADGSNRVKYFFDKTKKNIAAVLKSVI